MARSTASGTTAREKLIEAATGLMLSKGYPATTVDEICGAAGVSKGSFYHFFPSKEDLGLEVLEQYFLRGVAYLASGPHASLEDSRERTLGLVEHTINIADEMWSKGCLLGNFATDLSETNPRLQSKVSELFAELTRRVARMFEPVAASDPSSGPTAEELANMYLEVIEGSIVMAKAHRDPERIVRGIEAFRRYLQMLADRP